MKGDISHSIDMEIPEDHVKNNSDIKLRWQALPNALPLIVSRKYTSYIKTLTLVNFTFQRYQIESI